MCDVIYDAMICNVCRDNPESDLGLQMQYGAIVPPFYANSIGKSCETIGSWGTLLSESGVKISTLGFQGFFSPFVDNPR